MTTLAIMGVVVAFTLFILLLNKQRTVSSLSRALKTVRSEAQNNGLELQWLRRIALENLMQRLESDVLPKVGPGLTIRMYCSNDDQHHMDVLFNQRWGPLVTCVWDHEKDAAQFFCGPELDQPIPFSGNSGGLPDGRLGFKSLVSIKPQLLDIIRAVLEKEYASLTPRATAAAHN